MPILADVQGNNKPARRRAARSRWVWYNGRRPECINIRTYAVVHQTGRFTR
jgi:hypothetical protein